MTLEERADVWLFFNFRIREVGINVKKILITGASGFVGRNVKEYLEQHNKGYQIYAPTSKELDCLNEADVTKYLKEHRFDYVLHFAVYGDGIDKVKDGTRILDYNLRIFLNFYKNADCFGKMYYTGSGAEYDKRYDIVYVSEEEIGKTIPVDAYGLMKYTVGNLIEQSSNIYNFRLFGIFGKYEYYPTKFISNVCCKALKGLPLTMRQNVYFDYLWVDDFSRMIEYFLHHEPKYHTYNAVSGKKVSLLEICETVIQISGKDLPIYRCKEGWGKEYTASNRRLLTEVADCCITPMEQAIGELYQWYAQNEDAIDLYKLLY